MPLVGEYSEGSGSVIRASSVQSTGIGFFGWLCVLAGILGAVSAVVLLAAPPAVATDRLSYPFTPAGFSVAQVWFSIHHLGLLAGLYGLRRSGAAGTGRLGSIGSWAAMVGMILLAVAELAAITVADGPAAIAQSGWLGGLYGVSSIVIGGGLILAGVAVLRTDEWRDWRRFVPLVLGVYVFVPMTPALMASFVAARLAIGGWMLGFAVLGWALVKSAREASHGAVLHDTPA
jgi:hypothetical protein